jgi:hypothetical protein
MVEEGEEGDCIVKKSKGSDGREGEGEGYIVISSCLV